MNYAKGIIIFCAGLVLINNGRSMRDVVVVIIAVVIAGAIK